MPDSRKWPQALAVTLRHDPTVGGRCEQGRGERGDGQPGAERQARGLRDHPRRPCSPPSTCWATSGRSSCAASAPGSSDSCCRSCRTRSSPPSPRWSAAPSRSRGSRRCCARRRPVGSARRTTSSCSSPQQVSGVVFAGGNYALRAAPARALRAAHRASLPTIVINAAIDGAALPACLVRRHAAVEQAMGHLTSLGHTKIGLVLGSADHVPSQRKLAAARRCVAERARARARRRASRRGAVLPGEPVRPPPAGCCSPASPASSARATRWPSARSGPSAGPGCRVPEDVSVVGYDDSALHELHRPAAHDRAAAHRADGPGRHRAARRA